MSEVVQGITCKSCDRPLTLDECTLIRWNPHEGNVHIATCLNCIVKWNPGLIIKKD